MKPTIDGTGYVLVDARELEALRTLKERIEMKIRQLESKEFDSFGGFGAGIDMQNRSAYLRALKWALGIDT